MAINLEPQVREKIELTNLDLLDPSNYLHKSIRDPQISFAYGFLHTYAC